MPAPPTLTDLSERKREVLYAKLHANRRAEAIVKARQAGFGKN